ncbi:MAG: prepilin-type N-terminal cleavage/methylation domain-containing protein [Deltaproteobacteria bacterium]|nr:prepilin-type N-terminal cleavage/methylation domain-containing protein [Deltaproteobacteria bacterium]
MIQNYPGRLGWDHRDGSACVNGVSNCWHMGHNMVVKYDDRLRYTLPAHPFQSNTVVGGIPYGYAAWGDLQVGSRSATPKWTMRFGKRPRIRRGFDVTTIKSKAAFPRSARRTRRGFSLIELMIAVLLAAVLVAAIYTLFVSYQKAVIVQEEKVEIQQGGRAALRAIKDDVEMIGAGVRRDRSQTAMIHAAPWELVFNGDVSDVGELGSGLQVTHGGAGSPYIGGSFESTAETVRYWVPSSKPGAADNIYSYANIKDYSFHSNDSAILKRANDGAYTVVATGVRFDDGTLPLPRRHPRAAVVYVLGGFRSRSGDAGHALGRFERRRRPEQRGDRRPAPGDVFVVVPGTDQYDQSRRDARRRDLPLPRRRCFVQRRAGRGQRRRGGPERGSQSQRQDRPESSRQRHQARGGQRFDDRPEARSQQNLVQPGRRNFSRGDGDDLRRSAQPGHGGGA